MSSFRNLPFHLLLYYSIGVMIRKWTVPSTFPSCTSPVSDPDHVRFLFVRYISCSSLQIFKISGVVIHHFSLCTQLRILFNCNCFICFTVEQKLNDSGGVYLPFFLFLWTQNGFGIVKLLCGRLPEQRPSDRPPAKLLFEAASFWKALWGDSFIRRLLKYSVLQIERRLIGELLVTFSWSTLCDYYRQTPLICQSIIANSPNYRSIQINQKTLL